MNDETMKTVCAWCGVHVSGDISVTRVSHGICAVCDKKVNDALDDEERWYVCGHCGRDFKNTAERDEHDCRENYSRSAWTQYLQEGLNEYADHKEDR